MQRSLFFALALAFVGLTIASAQAAPTLVDCTLTPPDSVAQAVENGATDIIVSGSCMETETILITVDDFRLSGDGDDSVTGCIKIDGAQRARIENLTVTGCNDVNFGNGDSGIRLYNAATGYLFNVVSSNHEYSGIELRYDSFAEIRNSQLLNNDECGIILLRGAVGHGQNNTITNYLYGGLCLTQHATYTSERATISDLAGAAAIDVGGNSYLDLRGGDAAGDAIVALQSQLVVRKIGSTQSSVTGNFAVSSLSILNLRNASEIVGDIGVSDISILRVADTASIDGKVTCEHKTSVC